MALFLDETEVESLLSFRDVYESLRRFFLLEDQGLAVNMERVRTASHGTVLTYQAAAAQGLFGFKTFISGSFLGALFNSQGEPSPEGGRGFNTGKEAGHAEREQVNPLLRRGRGEVGEE